MNPIKTPLTFHDAYELAGEVLSQPLSDEEVTWTAEERTRTRLARALMLVDVASRDQVTRLFFGAIQ